MAVVGAHDDRGGVPRVAAIDHVDDPPEPVIDHRELGAVLGAQMTALALGQAGFGAVAGVRRPDQAVATPVGVVTARPRLRRVERLVRIELVDHEQGALLRTPSGSELPIEPLRGRGHRLRAGEVGFLAEPCAAGVVVAVDRGNPRRQRGRSDPRRIGTGAPRIVFVAAQVVPSTEVAVVVLAAGLEEMRVISDEHRRDSCVASQRSRDRGLPYLDRSPRSPREVERAHEQVVTSGHAREGTGVVVREPNRPRREAVEVRRVELRAAVAAEEVPIQAVEQHHDDITRTTHAATVTQIRCRA